MLSWTGTLLLGKHRQCLTPAQDCSRSIEQTDLVGSIEPHANPPNRQGFVQQLVTESCRSHADGT